MTLATPSQVMHEIEAGLDALRERYGAYVLDAPFVYAGFGLGATVGVSIVKKRPALFPVAVFGEGGFDELSDEVARGYIKRGTRRVMLVCSTRGCEVSYGLAAKRLARAGLEVKLIATPGTEPRFGGKVIDDTRAGFPWLVQDDPRYPKSAADSVKPQPNPESPPSP